VHNMMLLITKVAEVNDDARQFRLTCCSHHNNLHFQTMQSRSEISNALYLFQWPPTPSLIIIA
jgi:hypothetical protein